MAFSTVIGNGRELIEAWATAMIATGGWEDADTGLKTDGTTNPAGRVLKYTRTGEEIYVTMVHAFIGRNTTDSGFYSAECALVFISSGWSSASHIPSGTINASFIPLANKGPWAWPSGAPIQTSEQAQWWISANADIWAVLSVGVASAQNNSYAFLSFEREDALEYDTGGSKIFIYADAGHCDYNYSSGYDNGAWGLNPYYWSLPSGWSGVKSGISIRKYIHPFITSYPTFKVNGNPQNFVDGKDRSDSFLIVPIRATKSSGNSKVYMAFPTCFADPGTWRSPIKTLKAWFPVEPGQGIADGDLISIPVSWNGAAPVTWRYIYKVLTSPDGGEIDIAVFYDVPTP
jgi:hypothetical protein